MNRPNPGEHEKVSTFGMRFVALSFTDGRIRVARPQLMIDGEPIPEKLPVDLRKVIRSVSEEGRFYLFTCGCGSAGCAGVEEGVSVTHGPGRVIWDYRLPQSTDGFGSPAAWVIASSRHRHLFDRQQVIDALRASLLEAEVMHADGARYSPYGFERSDITEMLAEVEQLARKEAQEPGSGTGTSA